MRNPPSIGQDSQETSVIELIVEQSSLAFLMPGLSRTIADTEGFSCPGSPSLKASRRARPSLQSGVPIGGSTDSPDLCPIPFQLIDLQIVELERAMDNPLGLSGLEYFPFLILFSSDFFLLIFRQEWAKMKGVGKCLVKISRYAKGASRSRSQSSDEPPSVDKRASSQPSLPACFVSCLGAYHLELDVFVSALRVGIVIICPHLDLANVYKQGLSNASLQADYCPVDVSRSPRLAKASHRFRPPGTAQGVENAQCVGGAHPLDLPASGAGELWGRRRLLLLVLWFPVSPHYYFPTTAQCQLTTRNLPPPPHST